MYGDKSVQFNQHQGALEGKKSDDLFFLCEVANWVGYYDERNLISPGYFI